MGQTRKSHFVFLKRSHNEIISLFLRVFQAFWERSISQDLKIWLIIQWCASCFIRPQAWVWDKKKLYYWPADLLMMINGDTNQFIWFSCCFSQDEKLIFLDFFNSSFDLNAINNGSLWLLLSWWHTLKPVDLS